MTFLWLLQYRGQAELKLPNPNESRIIQRIIAFLNNLNAIANFDHLAQEIFLNSAKFEQLKKKFNNWTMYILNIFGRTEI